MKSTTKTSPSRAGRLWRLAACVALALAVGGLSAAISDNAISDDAMKSFGS